MKLIPLHDRIIVKPSAKEEKTAGGLIIPDSAQDKSTTGEIVAAGPGKRDDTGGLTPMGVTVGSTVLFGKFGGTEVELDGETHLIMRESDVFAVIEKGN